jgi:hypothetical protein
MKKNSNFLSEKIILPVLIILSALIRICGLKWGLPYLYHVDEARFAKIAVKYFSGDLNPHFFHVPSLHTYIIFALWKCLFFFMKLFGNIPQEIEFKEWFEADPTIPIFTGRIIIMLFSIGTVLLVYLIGKKIFNQKVGLIASLFLLLSPVHNRLSHSMLPAVPMIFFLVLSFYFIWFIYSKGNWEYYFLAGLFAGLGMATKYGGHLLFLPLFFAHLFSGLEKKYSLIKIFLNFKLILFSLFFLIGFFIGCPYAFFDFSTFWKDFNWQAKHLYTIGHYGSSIAQPAWLFYLKYGFQENIGKLSQYLVFIGVLLGIIRFKKREIILLCLPLFLLFTISNWKTYAVRYFLPAAPFFALIGAFAFDFLLTKIGNKFSLFKRKEILIWSLVVLLILIPDILKIIRFDYSLTQKDTRTIAKEWIERNIPKRKKIALEMYCPPISRKDYKVIYRHSLSHVGLEWLHKRKVEYIIVSDIMYRRFIRAPKEFPRQAKFYNSLNRETLLIKSFQPKWDEYLIDLHNPTIKIYRLNKYPNFSFPGNFNFYAQTLSFKKVALNKWKVETEILVKNLLKGNERVKNPYIKIINSYNEQIKRIRVFKGEIKSNTFHSDFLIIKDLPMNFKIKIGYEYYFSSPPFFAEPEGELKKESSIFWKIDRSILTQNKFKLFFLYFQFPNIHGDDYFQEVYITKSVNRVRLLTKIYGGELTFGNDYVLNPWIKIRNLKGEEICKVIIFKGKVGSYKTKRKAPIKKSSNISYLPEKFDLSVGYDYYFDKNFPQLTGGPEEFNFYFPLNRNVKHIGNESSPK